MIPTLVIIVGLTCTSLLTQGVGPVDKLATLSSPQVFAYRWQPLLDLDNSNVAESRSEPSSIVLVAGFCLLLALTCGNCRVTSPKSNSA